MRRVRDATLAALAQLEALVADNKLSEEGPFWSETL